MEDNRKLKCGKSSRNNLPKLTTGETSSPARSNYSSTFDLSFDSSPILSQATREHCDVDVIWDWSSPQSKHNFRRVKRQHNSDLEDKIPLKKVPASHQLPTFSKLKEKLEALKEEIATENSSLKDVNNKKSDDLLPTEKLDDLFNDSSFEEQLILCSQQVEKEFIKPSMPVNHDDKITDVKVLNIHEIDMKSIRVEVNNINENVTVKKKTFSLCDIFNEKDPQKSPPNNIVAKAESSLEVSLTAFENEDSGLFSNFNTSKVFNYSKDRSKCLETGIKPLAKNPQFKKTNSFDDSVLKNGPSRSLDKKIMEEIERKRKEAMARLEAKKRTQIETPAEEISPIKCSPDEIEQKRLQALAKLEAKRKQEVIERNRLEAMKRLEINKKKRVTGTGSQTTLQTIPKSLPRMITENNR